MSKENHSIETSAHALGWFAGFLGLVTFLCGCSPSVSTTEYIVLERHADIHIFELYLEQTQNLKKVDDYKVISMSNAHWASVANANRNAITDIRVDQKGDVVLENKTFGFQIVFEPKYTIHKIVWSCRIVDSSLIFHPQECENWRKEIETP